MNSQNTPRRSTRSTTKPKQNITPKSTATAKSTKVKQAVVTNEILLQKITVLEQLIVSLRNEVAELKQGPNFSLKTVFQKDRCQPCDQTNIESGNLQQRKHNIVRHETTSLRNNLVITGLPASDVLNPLDIIQKIGAHIKCPLESSDLSQLYISNITSESPNRKIFVKFNNESKRNNFFKAYLSTPNKVTQRHIDRSLPSVRVFVNEELTKDNYNIFIRAAELQKTGKIGKFYTKSGFVWIVEKGKTSSYKVSSINAL